MSIRKTLPTLLCALALTSCSSRRPIGGGYYLAKDANGSFYLFQERVNAPVCGPVSSIGWDRDFVLCRSSGDAQNWVVLDKRSGHSRVPADPAKRQDFAQRIGRFISVRSPDRAWHGE